MTAVSTRRLILTTRIYEKHLRTYPPIFFPLSSSQEDSYTVVVDSHFQTG